MQALLTIAGTPLPEPSSYEALTSTIVDSARNTAGYVIGAVVRDDVAKVTVSWKYMTAAQWAQVLGLFTGSFYNSVTFYDQATASYTTRTMYVSDRSTKMWRRHPATGAVMGWTECKLSLVER